MSLRNFFRLLRHGSPPDGHVNNSLAKAAKDSLHYSSGTGMGGGAGAASTSAVYKQIEKGHKNYTESFKKKE